MHPTQAIFSVLSAILHLGNVRFIAKDGDAERSRVDPRDRERLVRGDGVRVDS